MKVLDLFSGIGGFSLGLERAGMETVAFCEICPKARLVLKKHWPAVPCFDDVTTLTKEKLDAIGIVPDLICGGFPCQDISFAGRGAGLAGERSGLWSEFHRLIDELRPSWVVIENVSALRSRGLESVLGSLAAIGYDAEWHCVPASKLGAPHQRDRLWIIAYPSQEPGLHQPYIGQAAFGLFDDANYWLSSPWDEASPRVCRMDDGLSGRVDQTEQLGNAVVPQIPELIGRAIMAHTANRA